MLIDAEPTVLQVAPSIDFAAVKVLPARVSFT